MYLRSEKAACRLKKRCDISFHFESPQDDVTKNNPQEGRKRWDAVRLFGTNSLKEGAV
jgi:hypothetical protein